jgi:hypothetical protein
LPIWLGGLFPDSSAYTIRREPYEMNAERTVAFGASLHRVAVSVLNLNFVVATSAEFAVIESRHIVDQYLIEDALAGGTDHVFALREIGHSWNR